MHATKSEQAIDAQMQKSLGDSERLHVLAKARQFKRTWIELAQALTEVRERNSWQRWGYDSFDAYCKKELHLKSPTVTKLVGSFAFMKRRHLV